MKVEVDGKIYCVETLVYDNQRLRKEVIASGELRRLELENIKTELEEYITHSPYFHNAFDCSHCRDEVLRIIDMHIGGDAEDERI